MSTATARRPRRRGRTVFIVLITVIVLLGAAALVLDNVGRGLAEQRVETEIADRLGDNLAGPVNVEIGGWPFVTQVIEGKLESVEISDIRLVDEEQISHLVLSAQGVPIDTTQTVDHVEGSLQLDEVAANDWLDDKRPLSGRVAFETGAIVYTDSFSALGQTVDYSLAADLDAEGTQIMLTPTEVTVADGLFTLDVATILSSLGVSTIDICAADMLPEDADIQGIDLTEQTLTMRFEAEDIYLSEAALQSVGTCKDVS